MLAEVYKDVLLSFTFMMNERTLLDFNCRSETSASVVKSLLSSLKNECRM